MRVKYGKARHKSKKRLFKSVRGNRAGRAHFLRTVKETVLRARAFAFRDRRAKKRTFRALWITRITAACKMRGISYSRFIHALQDANIELNRKSLSEIAMNAPAVFDEIVALLDIPKKNVA